MFSLTVRDHIMVAHSLKGEIFGPAQRLHGATYIVDLELCSEKLNEYGVIVDIGMAMRLLKKVLEPLNYKNLDDDPSFKGKNTTLEFLAREIFERVAKSIREGFLGKDGDNINSIKVTIYESHIAWASYEARL